MKARIVNVAPEINVGKVEKLDELHRVYLNYARTCLTKMLEDRRPSVSLKDQASYFTSSDLSSHLVRGVWQQVTSLVPTWIKGLYARKLRHLIRKGDYSDQQRLELYTIGKYLVTKAGKFGKGEISQEMIDLFWGWVWNHEVSGNPPSISERLPIQLTGPIYSCSFKPSKEAKHFSWWIAVTHLTKGERLQIPLSSNPLITKQSKLANTVLAKKRFGKWTFQFVDKTEEPAFKGTQEALGVDVGLNCLAATSDGRVYGRDFKPRFDRIYSKVRSVRANRQRQGLKEDSPRLARLEQKLTGAIKTETGRVANKLVKDFPGRTFVIEDLDLKGCRGQKRFAYRQLHRSLASKSVVQTVNPAYTSQQCPSCGYVDRRNRSGIHFTCRSCGRISHADVVGGINLLGRSEEKQIGLNDHHSNVRVFLRARYRHRRDIASSRKKNELSGFSQKLTTRAFSKEKTGTASKPLEDSQ